MMVFYMFKKSVLFATLLSGVMAFSTNADDGNAANLLI
ncbi:hypothetical protein AD25_0280 [Escherichia coli 2-052-05_S4_C3]|nr:hypothetical protein AD25_0280 [Escherichia coli 2-052-05_S4_C3]